MILTGIILNLLIGTGALIILWFFYLWKKNPAVVDLGWAVGLTLMGLTHNLVRGAITTATVLTSVLILLWGLRLGSYLFWTRLRLGKKDTRYESIQKKQKLPAPIFFLIHYIIQACFQAVVGFVFIFTAQSSVFNSIYATAGLVLWCVGYAGSIVADAQLPRFRKNPDNRYRLTDRQHNNLRGIHENPH